MARIKTYGTDSVIQDTDLLLGSDSLYQFETANFSVGAIKTHVLAATALAYVPYTGATGDINRGAHSIYTTGGARLGDDGTLSGIDITFLPSLSSLQDSSSSQNVWMLPDQSGIIALTSDIDAANTLNDVLANGNTSLNNAFVNELGLADSFNYNAYGSVTGDKSRINFFGSVDGYLGYVGQNSLGLLDFAGDFTTIIRGADILTASRTVKFQDKDGVVAYLSDVPPGPITTPTLNEVLTEGNTSLLSANVGTLGIYDPAELGYGDITLSDGGFQFTTSGDNPVVYFEQNSFRFHKTDTIIATINTQLLSATRGYYLPNASGTIALTSDIPAAQVQSNWNETNPVSKAFILNKPTIATVPVDTTYFTDWEAATVPLTFDGQPLVTGSYVQTGDLVYFRINVDMDNVTSFGSGQYYMILPFDAKYDTTMPAGHLHDTTTNINYQLMGEVLAGSNVMQLYYATTNSLMEPFDNNSPKVLDLNDFFHISGTYIKE